MSSNGRRPVRPGIMSGGGAGQGGWVPGVSMPPLGYGLVAQQPHMAPPQPHMAPHQPLMAPPQQAWQQQQQQHFLAQQAGLAGTMGVATLTQQQQQQHQQKYPPQHIQQQWIEAQRKAAEEQRKLYEQMMKQRQFDEQKMRLKAFNASKKTGVSADTMIESILGGKEPPKQRSPQPPKKSGGVEEQGGQGNHHQATAIPTPQIQTHRQGTAVDWTKLENVNTLFASPKKTSPATATTTTTTGAEHPINPMQPPHDTITTSTPTNPAGPNNPSSRPQTTPHSMGDDMGKPGNGRKEGKSPIVLPQWMKDIATLPEVYKRAVGLVGAAEGWVDTSRAYMLLMKTGLPPPFLGVLWEMVNCTTPGQLTQMEFSVLLALVAVVQSGQPITGPEVLNGIREPVMPLIDHPALAPLVQDYIQARQQQQQQGMMVETGAGSSGGTGGGGGVGGTTQAQANTMTATNNNNGDDDEFDDFVSVTVPSNASIPPSQPQTSSLPSSSFPTPSIPPPQPQSSSIPTSSFPTPTFPSHSPGGLMGQPQTVPVPPGPSMWPQVATPRPLAPPQTQTGDKNKTMNLPKLGFSPEPSPTTSFDDDFDDFQSAALPCVPQAGVFTGGQQHGGLGLTTSTSAITTPTTATTNMLAVSTEQPLSPPVLQPEKPAGTAGEDKYAAFREITGITEQTTEVTENADDSFGEFCSSEVASLSLAQNASSSASTSSALPGLLQCQSASGTSNTSPISFEVYSTPPEALPDTQTDAFQADFSAAFASTSTSTRPPDNYADIHEAMKRAEAEQKRKEESKWSDPFGEFEEAPPPLSATTATCATAATFGDVSGVNGATSSLPSASGLSVPWLNAAGGTEEDEDEDFGDFMGHSGIGGGSSIHTLPPPLENLGETQSVASLELPGLEMTVGVDASEMQGGTDLFLQPRGDIGTVEDQLCGLSLDTATTAGGGTASSSATTSTTQQQQQQQQPSTTAGSVMDSYCSSGGLVDKYSIIREEASRDTQHHGEAHTGSWERCLEGIIKVLQEAHNILASLNTSTTTATTANTTSNTATTNNNGATTSLKSQVLATSQMQDYLANMHEVWLVCGRIRASSRRVTTSVRVDNLLSQAQSLWRDILTAAGADSVIAKPPVDTSANTNEEGDNQMGEGEVCGVCLTGGGSRLTYGGHSYHPPCANLWLNCVDLLLPSLTPVTLL